MIFQKSISIGFTKKKPNIKSLLLYKEMQQPSAGKFSLFSV